MCCHEYSDEDIYGVRYEFLEDGSLTVDSESMDDYDWKKWLDNGE